MKKIFISLMMILSLASKSQTHYVNLIKVDNYVLLIPDTVYFNAGDSIVFKTQGISVPYSVEIDSTYIPNQLYDTTFLSYRLTGIESEFHYETFNPIPFSSATGYFQLIVDIPQPQYFSKKVPFTISNNTINIVGDRLVVTNVFSRMESWSYLIL